ncbi:hypothetical protein HYH03_018351 [Edaphochlamys debaryana]|uniref:MYND-type domain-containing protein n=1 Tax=Edaphochlamys debaryana TaxID=47281 RepID=A0A836BNE4_9CHLO|nr:hypothetical protein HYH03_018351 [Edaphochlamys debaryana]|eukprot:KAG2482757.1 hypothetical protein HYH03_018351 [Edaphochlamys debaryana]
MCPEAEQEVRDFVAGTEAILGTGAGALFGLARSVDALRVRTKAWMAVSEAATDKTVAELLSRPAFRRALLLATNGSTRWAWSPAHRSAEQQEGLRARLEVLWSTVSLNASLILASKTQPACVDFVRRLVRSQTLEAVSGRLADVRTELHSLADDAVAAAVAGTAAPLLQASTELLTALVSGLTVTAALTTVCLQLAAAKLPSGPPGVTAAAAAAAGGNAGPSGAEVEAAAASGAAAGGSAGPSDSAAAASACYAQELAAALRASAVVEHTCAALAALLRLWAVVRTAVSDGAPAAMPLAAFQLLSRNVDAAVCDVTATLHTLYSLQPRAVPASPLASAALLGPCASFTALAHGVAVLSAMDGEGTRGLEPSVERGFCQGLQLEAEERLRGIPTSQLPSARVELPLRDLVSFLAAQDSQLPATAPPAAKALLPYSSAIALALRAARVGVQASAEAAAGRTAEQELAALTAARLGTGPCRVLLTWRVATVLAIEALTTANNLVNTGAETDGSVDLGEEWWRLTVALAPHLRAPAGSPGSGVVQASGAAGFAAHYGRNLLDQLPGLPLLPGPLPPAPKPSFRSALAGGVLPCLERLFRRAAASQLQTGPGGGPEASPPEAQTLFAFKQRYGDSWRWLAPLLAWGDARRRRRWWLEDMAARAGGQQAAGAAPGPGGGGAGALLPAERQLLEMLAAAVAAWLPPLFRGVWARYGLGTVGASALLCGLHVLPLLACADAKLGAPSSGVAAAGSAAAATGAAARVRASSAGAATAGQTSGGGGWLAGLSPVRFVGVALKPQVAETIMQLTAGSHLQLYLIPLAEACCAVAAALPEEVAKGGGAGPAWEPSQLRSLGAECRARGDAAAAEAVEALAAQLVRWAHGSGPRGGRGGARASAASGAQALAARFGAWFPGLEAAAALLPASPAAARACLGGCSNPACANLEGDSDAALPLRACAGCGGAASYCSRECQTAHWRSGHRKACRGGAGGGGGGARRSS